MDWSWDWSDFRKPNVLIGIVAGAIVGGALVWNTTFHRVPELEARENKQDSTLADHFAEINKNVDKQFSALRGDLVSMDGRYQERLKKMDLSITGLRVNMARVCLEKNLRSKTCSPEAIVADAKSATQAQAQFFTGAELTLDSGETSPQVASPQVRSQLPRPFLHDVSYTNRMPIQKADIPNALLWSSAADSARWTVVDGHKVVVTFANGTATFDMSEPNTTEHVGDLITSLKSTTEALKAAGNEAQEKK